jgi:hypothetical protein
MLADHVEIAAKEALLVRLIPSERIVTRNLVDADFQIFVFGGHLSKHVEKRRSIVIAVSDLDRTLHHGVALPAPAGQQR